MLKLFITLVFLTGIIEANCQSLVVKSFRWADPALKTTIPAPTTALKTNRYAIIKVETNQEGLTFDFGNSGKELVAVRQTGVIWLWVPAGVKKVDISNSLTGEKQTYPFGRPLGKTEFYVMVMDVDKMTLPTKDKIVEVKWFSIFTTPLGAQITIDSSKAGVTPFTGSLTMGTHSLELDYYGDVKKQEINVNNKLDPIIYMAFTGEGKPKIPVTYMNYKGEIKPKNPANDYFASDDAAQFPGGAKELSKFIRDKISYPIRALQNGITGTVYVQFNVDETGKISDIKILRGISGDCDQEAVRVVKLMPQWKPAQFEGKPTSCLFTLPVKFNTNIVNARNEMK
jgi:TonB family protein